MVRLFHCYLEIESFGDRISKNSQFGETLYDKFHCILKYIYMPTTDVMDKDTVGYTKGTGFESQVRH